MVWDDYYGKQNNPYDADDFRLLLLALKTYRWVLQDSDTPPEHREKLSSLIKLTQEALETEEE